MLITLFFFFFTVERFWKAHVKEDHHKDFLDFDFEAFISIFPETASMSKLFVRKAYTDLDKIIESIYDSRKQYPYCTKKVIITGTPGVGNTMFMLYQMYLAKRRCRNVVLKVGENKMWVFASTPYVSVSDDQDFALSLLNRDSTMFFFDPHLSHAELKIIGVAFTIMFASTNPWNHRIFKKLPRVTLYMPIWTLDELQRCHSLCYPTLSAENIEKGFKLWGGSARCVLSLSFKTSEENLRRFLGSDDLETVIDDMESVHMNSKPFDKNQWLVHISIKNDNYKKRRIHWPSEYVMEKVNVALKRHPVEWKKDTYKSRNLAGQIYETRVCCTLLATVLGGTDTKKLPVIQEKGYFSNLSFPPAFAPKKDVLYVPIEVNKKSADFVCNDWIFQATLRPNHDIKANGIATLSKQFHCKSWNFCFCVPRELHLEYTKKQKIVDSKQLSGIEIKQYIVAID